MLRTLLIATTLLTASGTALASDYYRHGRVLSVEPHFSIAFGSRHHDGFRVLFESGGRHYWTHSRHHPGHHIVLPPHHRVYYGHPGHHYGWKGHDKHHWKSHHKHHWKGHRDDWHDDRREYRREHREHREHHGDRRHSRY